MGPGVLDGTRGCSVGPLAPKPAPPSQPEAWCGPCHCSKTGGDVLVAGVHGDQRYPQKQSGEEITISNNWGTLILRALEAKGGEGLLGEAHRALPYSAPLLCPVELTNAHLPGGIALSRGFLWFLCVRFRILGAGRLKCWESTPPCPREQSPASARQEWRVSLCRWDNPSVPSSLVWSLSLVAGTAGPVLAPLTSRPTR